MRIARTELAGVLLITPDVHSDGRGVFLETYHAERYRAHGITTSFVQDNYSRSTAGTLRGLHLQVDRPQAKLIRVVHGEIFDVAVDVRRGSPTFGRWVGTRLAADAFTQCYIPTGFAHGFCVMSDAAWVEYKCSDFYDPSGEVGIAWNDPALAIAWPVAQPLLSDRDRQHPTLADAASRLPVFDGETPNL
jgi:dTDP-4-dehydrorhamnose 3,5-epimerase